MEKEIKLSDGRTIKMREPKVRDMKIASQAKNKSDEEVTLIGNLTGLTVDEIDDLTMRDYMSLQKALKDFLEPVGKKQEEE
ncbi:MAG TPA: phage tail assembly protein [Aliarcobacter sp.]|nr:phage tail assembly protein [Aliarcobacter sp.]